jgi:hypothetical protein
LLFASGKMGYLGRGKSDEASIDSGPLAGGACGDNIVDGRQHCPSGRRVQAKARLNGTIGQQMGLPDQSSRSSSLLALKL